MGAGLPFLLRVAVGVAVGVQGVVEESEGDGGGAESGTAIVDAELDFGGLDVGSVFFFE